MRYFISAIILFSAFLFVFISFCPPVPCIFFFSKLDLSSEFILQSTTKEKKALDSKRLSSTLTNSHTIFSIPTTKYNLQKGNVHPSDFFQLFTCVKPAKFPIQIPYTKQTNLNYNFEFYPGPLSLGFCLLSLALSCNPNLQFTTQIFPPVSLQLSPTFGVWNLVGLYFLYT
jgi:hypothetical protein